MQKLDALLDKHRHPACREGTQSRLRRSSSRNRRELQGAAVSRERVPRSLRRSRGAEAVSVALGRRVAERLQKSSWWWRLAVASRGCASRLDHFAPARAGHVAHTEAWKRIVIPQAHVVSIRSDRPRGRGERHNAGAVRRAQGSRELRSPQAIATRCCPASSPIPVEPDQLRSPQRPAISRAESVRPATGRP